MGAVHLAMRDDDEYRTAVAIKLLHGGLETAEAVARFRDERQILATLEHPGIVRLLDGGSTAERLPYLVMEHVVGLPITEWADARNLDATARVMLFRKVCGAVAYAHQKLVVHRDIKPRTSWSRRRESPSCSTSASRSSSIRRPDARPSPEQGCACSPPSTRAPSRCAASRCPRRPTSTRLARSSTSCSPVCLRSGSRVTGSRRSGRCLRTTLRGPAQSHLRRGAARSPETWTTSS